MKSSLVFVIVTVRYGTTLFLETAAIFFMVWISPCLMTNDWFNQSINTDNGPSVWKYAIILSRYCSLISPLTIVSTIFVNTCSSRYWSDSCEISSIGHTWCHGNWWKTNTTKIILFKLSILHWSIFCRVCYGIWDNKKMFTMLLLIIWNVDT